MSENRYATICTGQETSWIFNTTSFVALVLGKVTSVKSICYDCFHFIDLKNMKIPRQGKVKGGIFPDKMTDKPS